MTGEYDDPNYCPLDEELGEPATFHFPSQCCRCLAPSPTKEWQVSNGKRVDEFHVTVTFTIRVPVCSDCFALLRGTQIKLMTATAFLALLTAAALWYFDPFDRRNAELKDLLMMWSVTALFLFPVFLGVYFALGALFVPKNMRAVAYLNRDGNRLTFYNPEYQRIFANYYPPAETPELSYADAVDERDRW